MTSSSETKFPLEAKGYELLEDVGDGVRATVYRARCIPLDEIVAIKIWNLEKCMNDLETIRKQVDLMSLIDHPNLLSAHCSFIDGNSLWIVTPYISGGSCFNIMKSVYPEGLEQPVIATLLREVLRALVYLHGQGHIHQDVKAGNILVDTKGTVKLGDFGVLSTNTIVGTPSWMAPEVMQQDYGYDFKVDIWSFGITALELAHGHAPFSKYSPMEVLLMTLQNSPRLDNEKDKKFSKSFRELVAACLVKDPNNRPTAATLMKYPFFELARSTECLSSILDGLSPLGERYRKLKEEDAKLLEGIDGNKEKLSQREYLRGISSWNFDLEDLRKQIARMPDDELSIPEIQDLSCNLDLEFDVPESSQTMSLEVTKRSEKDMLSLSNIQLTEAQSPPPTSQLLPSLRDQVDISSGSDDKEIEDAENEQAAAAAAVPVNGNPAGPVNGNPAGPVNPVNPQVLPVLQNLLHQNEIQRERLRGLVQIYDPTAENINPMVNIIEAGQITREAELECLVSFLQQRVENLEEEVENKKNENAELEEEINRLTMRNSDP